MERRSTLAPAVREARHGALAAIVAARRLELDLTQVEASELAGVTPRTLRSVEKGQNVTLDNLSAILASLGLHLEVHRGRAPATVAPAESLRTQYGLSNVTPAEHDDEEHGDREHEDHDRQQKGAEK